MQRLALKKSPSPLERHEQETYFGWLHYQRYKDQRVGDFAFAVPNGGYMLPGTVAQRAIYGNALVKQGLRRGVPDVFVEIPVKPYHGLRIEFKRIGGAKPGDDQSMWHARLRQQGYYVAVCYGFEEAKAVTLEYLNGRPHGTSDLQTLQETSRLQETGTVPNPLQPPATKREGGP